MLLMSMSRGHIQREREREREREICYARCTIHQQSPITVGSSHVATFAPPTKIKRAARSCPNMFCTRAFSSGLSSQTSIADGFSNYTRIIADIAPCRLAFIMKKFIINVRRTCDADVTRLLIGLRVTPTSSRPIKVNNS